MHTSRLAPDCWPDAMQPLGAVPTGQNAFQPLDAAPFTSSHLSTVLEFFVLVTMSGLVSLLLSIIAAGAV